MEESGESSYNTEGGDRIILYSSEESSEYSEEEEEEEEEEAVGRVHRSNVSDCAKVIKLPDRDDEERMNNVD